MAAITPLVGPSNRQRRRGLVGLVAATAIGSTGLAAGGTAGPLLAADLTGSQAAAGLPLGVLVMGSAVAALLISRGTTGIGRGRALMAGYGAGAVGAGLVVLAAAMGNLVALIVGSCILGSANAAIFLTRYAAAEIGGEAERGRALGTVLFATTLGAVASPSLLGPSASLAKAAGTPPLSGLYMVAFVSFAVAALVLGGASAVRAPFLGLAAPLFATRGNTITIDRGEVRTALRARATRNALVILALTNLVMVAVMAIAPVDMRSHGHDLQLVGVAISTHVAGMFAPSPVSGWVADRVGARAVAAAGLALLLSSGLAGAMVNLGDATSTIAVLAVLGVGWNLGIVGGSTLLVGSVPEPVRPHAEGIGEGAMGFAAAAGAPAAGVVASAGSFATVWLAGVLIATAGLASLRAAARVDVVSSDAMRSSDRGEVVKKGGCS